MYFLILKFSLQGLSFIKPKDIFDYTDNIYQDD